jgi:hypothetical protein
MRDGTRDHPGTGTHTTLAVLPLLTAITLFLASLCHGAGDIWTQKADFGGTARQYAVGFSIGTKAYLGTGWDGAYRNDFWEYDPSANKWTQKADFDGTGRIEAVGFFIGAKGYIGTGFDGSFRRDFWEYDPSANKWTQKADFGGRTRMYAVGFSIGSKGYTGTGYDGSPTYRRDFWEYDPSVNEWTQKADFGGSGRSSATGFSIGPKGYIGTGDDASSFKKDFWEYDPSVNEWTQKADFGGAGRIYAVGFSAGTKGYIGMGYSGSLPYLKDFWEYDPFTGTWIQKADFAGPGRMYSAGFSIGTKGYIGTGRNGSYMKDLWELVPSESFVYPLSTGWNFVSFCRQPPGSGDFETALGPISANINVVWSYDSEQKSWKRWKLNDPNNSLSTLEPGRGYWVNASSPTALNASSWSDAIPAPNLLQGWNMTGYCGIEANLDALFLPGHSLYGKWSIFWNWEAGSWKVRMVDPIPGLPIDSLTVFQKGKAYWIKVKTGTGQTQWVQ